MKIISLLIKKYLENYKGLSRASWQGILLILLESSVIGIIFFLSIYFMNVLNLDIATSGIIISFYGMGTVFGGSFGGFLSDKFSSKKIAVINLIIETICMFLLSSIKSPVLLMINLFLLGFATYGFSTSIDIWVLGKCQQTHVTLAKVINISRVGLNIGFSLSGIIIGFLSNYGFNKIFYLYTIILLIAIVYMIVFMPEQKSKNEMTASSVTNKENISEHKIKQNKKIIITVALCLFFVGLIISQLSVTYPIYVNEKFPALGMKSVSFLFILDTILIMLIQAPLVNVLSKFNHVLMVGIGSFLMGLGMLILCFSFTFYLAILSCIVWATGEMIFIAMAQLVFYNSANENKKGKQMGFYQSILASSKILGPMIGSFIYFNFGGSVLWYLSALIGFVCLIACNHYKKYAY